MATSIAPFTPQTATQNVDVSGSSQSLTLTMTEPGLGGRTLRIYNASTADVFLDFGVGSATATAAASYPIPSGAVEFISLSSKVDTVGIIGTASSGKCYVTEGQGA